MGYLSPDYTHDVFVSYSHADPDGTGQSELKSWSQAFVRELEAELRSDPRLSGINVFLDESRRLEHGLDRTQPPADQLRSTIEGSALLAVLMSEHYLGSGWCRDEREWWHRHHGARGDVRGRVVVARIWPTDHADWPPELRDAQGHPIIGFWFTAARTWGSTPAPTGWRGVTSDLNERVAALTDLAGTITNRLKATRAELDERRRQREDAARLTAPDSGQILYLHAHEAHRDCWERVHLDLDSLGYVIMPGEPERPASDPLRVKEVNDERVDILGGCDALLLVGTGDGLALDRDLVTIGRQSRQLARARSGKLLPCAVLDTAGAAHHSAQRLAAVRKLDIDWLDATAADWPARVRSWLQASGRRLGDGA